jgi:hypothetical protein
MDVIKMKRINAPFVIMKETANMNLRGNSKEKVECCRGK